MRVTRITFQGYQRLVDTSCSTSGKMIAFVGPNEAGKTTVLRALDWFSNGKELPAGCYNKADPPADDGPVVSVKYWLEPEDVAAVEDLGMAQLPRFFVRQRLPDGEYRSFFEPLAQRDKEPFDTARALFKEALAAEGDPPDEDESEPHLSNWSSVVLQALEQPDGSWLEEWDEDFDGALEHLRGNGKNDLVARLDSLRSTLSQPHPRETARSHIKARAPRFVLFTEEDRALRSSYDLSNEELRGDPPKALANLAWVAGLDLVRLWEAMQAGDVRAARTAERRANEQLADRLSSRWSQRELRVEFNVDGDELEVQIFEEASDGAVTPVEERSDGFRTFIALVAFLARHDFKVPPVLLVDEAETHLHYDAQADLIEVLTKDVGATQVFYTTHSPGCLPRDLGTGIRLVEPDAKRSDASRLRNDFWSSDSPGFTPLLFAMGAGAAAFSAFRKAVLTEGAADMILLPTLLRLATGKRDLDFQVAPGIANYHGSGLELEEVAARVVYLVDGDAGGDDHRRRLLEMGITEDRIKQFEAPTAVEDYVHPDQYLGMVNDYLGATGQEARVRHAELDPSVSLSKAVEIWCGDHGMKPPGKTIIPSRLVDDPDDIRLADGANEKLKALHAELSRALNARPSKRGQ